MSRIGDWLASGVADVFVVAEAANAHDGDADRALALVDVARRGKAHAVKFQRFTPQELLVNGHSMTDVFTKLQLPQTTWVRLRAEAKKAGVDFIVDVFGHESLAGLQELDPDAYKIHSSDATNKSLLMAVARCGKPVLLSTGGTTDGEIREALLTLREAGATDIVLMSGIQTFPTPLEATVISRIARLRSTFDLAVGLADHVDGETTYAKISPMLGVAAGARLIEKHITLNRAEKGTDYVSALHADELAAVVDGLGPVVAMVGQAEHGLSGAEKAYRRVMKKKLVAARDMPAGHVIRASDLTHLRTDTDAPIRRDEDYIGRRLVNNVEKDMIIRPDTVEARTWAVLACRNGSDRLYGKPFQLVGGRPIIGHLIDRLRTVPKIDGIVLAIAQGQENEGFKAFARAEGLPFVVGDEKDVLGRLIQAADHVRADVVVRVTTENPFIHHAHVDQLIESHVQQGADISFMELLPMGAHVEVINAPAMRRSHKWGDNRHRSEYCTLYIMENPDDFVICRHEAPKAVARPELRLTVDTPEDLIVVRAIYAALHEAHGHLVPLEAIVSYLDDNPAIKALNAGNETLKLWR